MKLTRKLLSVLAIVMLVLMVSPMAVSAAAYQTYTYSVDEFPSKSPDAYTPEIEINSKYMGLVVEEMTIPEGATVATLTTTGKPIDDPRDLFVDKNMNVYIADAANNRIVVLNEYYKLKFEINEFVNDQGIPDALNTPAGVFVTDANIFVADSENNRIVVFDLEGEFAYIIPEPKDDVFPENSIYKPVALAVDSIGSIYVISSTTYMGVIALNSDGSFRGFIGAQKVTYDVLDIIWRRFQTAAQRALTTQYVSTEYNNIAIDESGFVYVTTSSIDETNQQAAIKSKAADYSPVKRLNSSGNDIMKRNGFFGPGGEVDVMTMSFDANAATGPSKIIDVALGPEGTWSIIDEKRSRVYTYDSDGKMLFIFGDTGMQLGNISSIEAIAYQGDKILILDKTRDSFTVYNRTEYGDILLNALHNNNARRYDLAVEDWNSILQRNSNFDAAYVGIGKALFREGKWEEAMETYKFAYDTENYSKAFQMYRKDWVSKNIIVIPIFIIVVCLAIYYFMRFANKVNSKTAVSGGKRTFGQEILYAFHLIFHPFDGFWDLKHEKRGSVRASFFWIALSIIAFTYQAIGRSYMHNPRGSYATIIIQVTSLVVPLLLWVTANWCLTTLFDGEGSFRDIFIACSYSLTPLPLFVIPATLATHILTTGEAGIINLILAIAYVWLGMLIFFGMMVTHDYSLAKNILTSLGTIVGMAVIMFIILLFTGLLSKMVGFVSSIYTEISYRL